MGTVKAVLIAVAVITFIMFLLGVPGAIGFTLSAIFFLIIFRSSNNDDSEY